MSIDKEMKFYWLVMCQYDRCGDFIYEKKVTYEHGTKEEVIKKYQSEYSCKNVVLSRIDSWIELIKGKEIV